jgi:hypothetical protein
MDGTNALESKRRNALKLCIMNHIMMPLFIDVVECGPWRKTKYLPFYTAIKCHGANILHKVAVMVVKKSPSQSAKADIFDSAVIQITSYFFVAKIV